MGLFASLLPVIPNILWIILPPVPSSLFANDSGLPFVEVVGTVCQALMIAVLILVVSTRKQSTANKVVTGAVGLVCLTGYLLLWVWYFTAPITQVLLLMMAVLPSVYFVCVGLYLKNYPSLIPSTLFAVIHISSTAAQYI
ncbi:MULTISPECIES: hypothetical protein [unclassified Ornithinimicrobium]|uniref:hypothetical protein n=1 Tax=unclassified Ornithinimicrobium TaxID=2615080 RepID=UPI003852F8CE